MASIAELSIKLSADVARLQADLNKGRAEFKKFAKGAKADLGGINEGITLLKRAIGALGIGVSIQGLIGFTKRALEAAGGIGELAQQVGVGATALQSLQFAAVQSGVSAEELNTGLMVLTRTIGDATSGNRTAQKTFTDLGVSFKNTDGSARSTESVLRDVMTALQGMNDAGKEAAAANDLFGRSGQRLLPILSSTNESLDDFIRKAKDAGVVLNDQMIKQADAASDAWARLDFKIQALSNTLVSVFAPAIEYEIDTLTRLINLKPNLDDWKQFFGFLADPFGIGRSATGIANMISPPTGVISAEDAMTAAGRRGLRPGHALETPAPPIIEPTTGTSGGVRHRGTSQALSDQLQLNDVGRQAIDILNDQIKAREDLNQAVIDMNMKAEAARFEEWTAALEDAKQQAQALTDTFGSLASGLVNAAAGFQSWKDFAKQAIDSVFSFLFDQLKQLQTLGGQGGGMFGGSSIFGSLFSGLFGGLAGGGGGGIPFMGIPSGFAMAGGGHTAANQPHLVGERGPELFVPDVSGSVMPAGEWGGGTTYNIDARGATKDAIAELRRMMREINRSIEPRIDSRVIDQRRRGGQYADVFA